MNQILATNPEPKKSRNKKQKSSRGSFSSNIVNVTKFFAIGMTVFGGCIIGSGSYALYKEIDESRPENIPDLTITRDGDVLLLQVDHNTEISKINYRWNDGEVNSIPEGTTYAEEEILLPDGNNVLNITVIDMKNREYQFIQEYNLEGVDITKPNIDVTQTEEGTANISISATDETEIIQMTYKINDDQEVVIEATEEGQKEIKKDITLPEGQSTLTVVAKDATGNTTTYEKQIIASSKPTIEIISKEGNVITLKIADKYGLKDVVVNLNGKVYESKDIDKNPNLNKNEIYVPLELQSGNNVLSIQVINVNGLEGTAATQLQQ